MSALAALDPAVGRPLTELIDGVWDGRVNTRLVERCRLRICQMLGANPGTARHRAAPTVEVPVDDRDRACLAFTEQWVLDPHAVTDELAAAVSNRLSPGECAAFTIALAVLEAQIRADLTLRALA